MEEHKFLHLTSKLWQEQYNLEMEKEKLAFEILDLEKRRLDFLADTNKMFTGERNATNLYKKKNDISDG